MEICIFIFTLVSLLILLLLISNLKSFVDVYTWNNKQRSSSKEQSEQRYAELKDYLKLLTKHVTQIEQTLYSMQHKQDVKPYEQEKKTKKQKKKDE